jgi:hypothetical protein
MIAVALQLQRRTTPLAHNVVEGLRIQFPDPEEAIGADRESRQIAKAVIASCT